jgi:hypothetical protein
LGVKYKSCYFSNHAILLELSSRPFRKKFKFIGSDIGSDIRCLLEKSFKKKNTWSEGFRGIQRPSEDLILQTNAWK